MLFGVVVALAPTSSLTREIAARGSVAPRRSRAGHPLKQGETMKIRLKVNGKSLEATLKQGETTRDFVFIVAADAHDARSVRSRKVGHLARAISDSGERTQSYQVGEIVYCPRAGHRGFLSQ